MLWDNDLRHWGHLGSVGDPACWPGFGSLPAEHLNFLRGFIERGKCVPMSPRPVKTEGVVKKLSKGSVDGLLEAVPKKMPRVGGPTTVLRKLRSEGQLQACCATMGQCLHVSLKI